MCSSSGPPDWKLGHWGSRYIGPLHIQPSPGTHLIMSLVIKYGLLFTPGHTSPCLVHSVLCLCPPTTHLGFSWAALFLSSLSALQTGIRVLLFFAINRLILSLAVSLEILSILSTISIPTRSVSESVCREPESLQGEIHAQTTFWQDPLMAESME